jgi:hypothetical protein
MHTQIHLSCKNPDVHDDLTCKWDTERSAKSSLKPKKNAKAQPFYKFKQLQIAIQRPCVINNVLFNTRKPKAQLFHEFKLWEIAGRSEYIIPV